MFESDTQLISMSPTGELLAHRLEPPQELTYVPFEPEPPAEREGPVIEESFEDTFAPWAASARS